LQANLTIGVSPDPLQILHQQEENMVLCDPPRR
jgi:hypothetical protein